MKYPLAILLISLLSISLKAQRIYSTEEDTINQRLVFQDNESSLLFSPILSDKFVVESCPLFKEIEPFVLFVNKYKTEYLKAILWEGQSYFDFYEFEIGKLDSNILDNIGIPYIILLDSSFYIDSGLKLGCAKHELVALKGGGKEEGNIIFYCYHIEGFWDDEPGYDSSESCDYYLRCLFQKNKLISLRFGYEKL